MNNDIVKKISEFLLDKVSNIDEDLIWSVLWDREEIGDGNEVYKDFINRIGASKCKYGVTKLVLFFDDFPYYVVKIPFLGSIGEDGIEHFFNCENYCEIEYKNYSQAKSKGLEKAFAEIVPAGNYSDMEFYVAKRIEEISWVDISTPSKDSRLKNIELTKSCNYAKYWYAESFLKSWGEYFIEQYGFEFTDKLVDFIEDNGIDDLYNSNVGQDETGRFVLLDYSSYEE